MDDAAATGDGEPRRDVVEVGQDVGEEVRADATGRAVAPAAAPEIQPRPPMTAYWTSRIEPKTLKVRNCTLGCRNASRMPPSAAMPAPTANA